MISTPTMCTFLLLFLFVCLFVLYVQHHHIHDTGHVQRLLFGRGRIFLACEYYGRWFGKPFPACVFVLFFPLQVEISSNVSILCRPRIGPWWFSELRQLWTNFPDELRVSSFIPHFAWTAQSTHSDFIWPRVYVCLAVTCHLHF